MMPRRCNHLLVLPFPAAAALLANAASISTWSGSAFSSWPVQALKNHRRRHYADPSLPSCLRRSMPLRIPAQKNCVWSAQRRCYSLAATRGYDGVDSINDVVISVKDSLRYDLVEPHLDTLSVPHLNHKTNENGKGNHIPIPTLVLLLAVSGGCDSIALFHSVLALKKSNPQCKAEEFVTYQENIKENDSSNPPHYLYLGKNNTNVKDDQYRVPCELHVAHFNHEQRGESSDGDESFVKKLCEEHGIPFHCYTWSDEDFSPRGRSLGSEATDGTGFDGDTNIVEYNDESFPASFTQDVARKWRRRKLMELLSHLVIKSNEGISGSDESLQNRWGAILTAHHRDDADETLLLKLLRGSHLTNMQSMDARSDGFDLQLIHNTEKQRTTSVNVDSLVPESNLVGYFAKPMLKIRKKHITEYLESSALEWREDESNSSNKYKRNKIRNELMPLLSEIAGGDHALQRRFSNLEQQSSDISRDLSKRSKDILQAMPSSSSFLLPEKSEIKFDIVYEDALHRWIMQETDRKLQLPYDQMMRIRDQILNYPNRLQWTLDVGGCWKIQRNGETLVVFRSEEKKQKHDEDNLSNHITLPWIVVCHNLGSDQESHYTDRVVDTLELCFGLLPYSSEHFTLETVRVKYCGNIKFSPPWRKGRSAIKIKEFLRGQKVPLHRRDDAIILCLSVDSARHALAVYLEGTGDDGGGRWIVNAEFSPQDAVPVTNVVLGRTSV